jgi:ubiquinone/menaquinone biosynthesis C-methylase UbiE
VQHSKLVVDHYTHGSLVEAILRGIQQLGKTTDTVDIDDLGPVDEFHIGGRSATESFLDQLDIDASHHVLDVGCGLGGASRFAANKYGCRVTGVDITKEYVHTGSIICAWLGLADKINLAVEDALHLSLPPETFERVYMLHVGMNIVDKDALAKELYRVTRTGGRIGIYDVMRVGDGEMTFPVPWATGPQGSAVAPPAIYRSALDGAGYHIVAERNRRDFALGFFAQMQTRGLKAGKAPPLGLQILMGETAGLKIANMIENISRNIIAPIEIIADKRK